MAKKESNKGIYIFWGVIALIIAIVLIIIFVPNYGYMVAYNNLNQISLQVKEVDSKEYTLSNYVSNLIEISNVKLYSFANVTRINNLQKIQALVEESTQFNLHALAYTDYVDRSITAKQTNAYKLTLNELSNTMNYCKQNIYPYLQVYSTQAQSSYEELLEQFLNQYYEKFVRAYANVYIQSAYLAEKTSTRSLEINQENLTANKDIMIELEQILSNISITSPDITQKINNLAITASNTYGSI